MANGDPDEKLNARRERNLNGSLKKVHNKHLRSDQQRKHTDV